MTAPSPLTALTMATVLAFGAGFAAWTGAGCAKTQSTGGISATLAYTHNVEGDIEPCG